MQKNYRAWLDNDVLHIEEDTSGCLAQALGAGFAGFILINIFSEIISLFTVSIILYVISGRCSKRVTGLRVLTIGNLVQAIYSIIIMAVCAAGNYELILHSLPFPLACAVFAICSRKRIAAYTDEIWIVGPAKDIQAAENARSRNIYTMVCSFAVVIGGFFASVIGSPLLFWGTIIVCLALILALNVLCAFRTTQTVYTTHWHSM